ncbi:MAG: hypothetical protein V2I27_03655 [Erythrobacter sp.]|jgi:hypothetical protein|nr:hypothetical protein [Erythrobacter sp.]
MKIDDRDRITRKVDRGTVLVDGQRYTHPNLRNREAVTIAKSKIRNGIPMVHLPELGEQGWAELEWVSHERLTGDWDKIAGLAEPMVSDDPTEWPRPAVPLPMVDAINNAVMRNGFARELLEMALEQLAPVDDRDRLFVLLETTMSELITVSASLKVANEFTSPVPPVRPAAHPVARGAARDKVPS